ncbi:MAG: DEAD/DEAH box helicase family protein [Lachnospiraceae bacterium]|nr:DEAD/DEAH box helicase family protein [Lachnospiraceae bacterium]
MPSNNQNLYEKLDVLRQMAPESIKSLPNYIKENLNVSEIRKYQEEAFTNFITYFENENMRMQPSKTLFWMATGSGKTLIMAGLMLYLYKQGYRDFMFFVNNNNIVKKTINNFTEPNDTKYLFAKDISIDGQYIKINKIDTFSKSDPDAINIVFTSIQGLHNDISIARENRISLDTFNDRKVVLIADEAHHNNASTRKKGKKIDNLDEATWENTISLVYNCNPNNVLLEFTATYEYQNEEIVKEYSNKIIYNYGLKEFRHDKYSKEIDMVRSDLDVMDKCILAMVFSQYRLKLFADNHIDVKPCILFKAHQTIEECNRKIEEFKALIKTLTGDRIKTVIESIDDAVVKNVVKYFKDKNISYNDLCLELKEAFSENHIISANDNDVESNQLALNSLEDESNPYRAIFEVRKLDEGWDVLNLFDIVRMYTSREGGRTTIAPATMSEAQLIGRGARYYPFKLKSDDPLYQRKFDEDLDNPLRMCETLLYHCQTDSEYLSEIKKALVETGAMDDKKYICHYKIKDVFKNQEFYKKGLVYYNERLKRPVESITGIDEKVRFKTYSVIIDTGLFGYNAILSDDDASIDISSVKIYEKSIKEISDINYAIVHKALMKYPILSFDSLKSKYPNLKSTKEFITSDSYMGNIKVQINTKNDYISNEMFHKAVLKVAGKLASHIESIGERYEGSKVFKPALLSSIFSDKKVEYSDIVSNGRGEAQKDSSDLAIRIDLSKEEWFAYEENYGTNEEKEFIAYFKRRYEEFKKRYDVVYLIRNERQLALYSFNDGDRFEPDYVLFLQKKNEKNSYDQLQVFIEPKGDHLLKDDKWKEDFLLQLKDESKCEINMLSGDNEYNIWGVHFYNKKRNALEKDFDKDIENLLADKNIKKTSNVIETVLSKKLAAHIDIGKMMDTLDNLNKEQ